MKARHLALAYVGAAFISNIGTHMQGFSEQWLVLLQAGPEAARWAGRMSFATGLGVALATPLGGWLADHARRGRSLAWTQVGLASLALAMAFLAWKGRLGLLGLVGFALAGGTFGGLMIPLQLSLVGDLSEGHAGLFGLMQVQWNLSRIVGPLVAATLFALLGPAGNFLLNALSFLPLVLFIAGRREAPPAPRPDAPAGYREAWRALGSPALAEVMGTAALFGLFGWSLLILAPVYGTRYLALGERGVAGLFAAFGLGAVASGLAVAAGRLGRDTARGLRLGLVAFALALLLVARPHPWLTPATLVLGGFGSGLAVTSLGTRVRQLAPPELLGRINALYALAIVGLSPLGTLAAGEAAHALGWNGPRWVFAAQAVLLLLWRLRLGSPSGGDTAPSIPA